MPKLEILRETPRTIPWTPRIWLTDHGNNSLGGPPKNVPARQLIGGIYGSQTEGIASSEIDDKGLRTVPTRWLPAYRMRPDGATPGYNNAKAWRVIRGDLDRANAPSASLSTGSVHNPVPQPPATGSVTRDPMCPPVTRFRQWGLRP